MQNKQTNTWNRALIAAGALALILVPAASPVEAGSCGAKSASATTAKLDIVDTAVEAGTFNTLVAAVKAAGLVEALKGDGPLTVFAPTDEAFAKLPAGTVESLLEPANRDKLVSILTYHVVSGDVYSADARPGSVDTLQGSPLEVSRKRGALMIDGARVIQADIATSNGVIHVIDQVIMPQPDTHARAMRTR